MRKKEVKANLEFLSSLHFPSNYVADHIVTYSRTNKRKKNVGLQVKTTFGPGNSFNLIFFKKYVV